VRARARAAGRHGFSQCGRNSAVKRSTEQMAKKGRALYKDRERKTILQQTNGASATERTSLRMAPSGVRQQHIITRRR